MDSCVSDPNYLAGSGSDLEPIKVVVEKKNIKPFTKIVNYWDFET